MCASPLSKGYQDKSLKRKGLSRVCLRSQPFSLRKLRSVMSKSRKGDAKAPFLIGLGSIAQP
jgi:hypothetical protein